MRLPQLARIFVPFRVLDDAFDTSVPILRQVANWILVACFITATGSAAAGWYYHAEQLADVLFAVTIALFIGSFMTGILSIIFPAGRDIGRHVDATKITRKSARILRKTVLYIFIPAAVITALLLVWTVRYGAGS